MATSPIKFQSNDLIEDIIRAQELTRQLQDEIFVLLSSSPNIIAIDHLFRDVFGSLSAILNKVEALSHPQAVDSDGRDGSNGSKKRRKQETKINLTTTPHDDGYQWKKYGQKQINNSKFPRSYYKCAHHKDQGCPATKTIQQKDGNIDEPPKFIVTFGNQHTCRSDPETCPPFVMDSSRRETWDIVSDSNFGKKDEDLLPQSSIAEFEFDDVFFSALATPTEDAMSAVHSPVDLWSWVRMG